MAISSPRSSFLDSGVLIPTSLIFTVSPTDTFLDCIIVSFFPTEDTTILKVSPSTTYVIFPFIHLIESRLTGSGSLIKVDVSLLGVLDTLFFTLAKTCGDISSIIGI